MKIKGMEQNLKRIKLKIWKRIMNNKRAIKNVCIYHTKQFIIIEKKKKTKINKFINSLELGTILYANFARKVQYQQEQVLLGFKDRINKLFQALRIGQVILDSKDRTSYSRL